MFFYKVSIAEILKMRNNIVLQTVVPALERNGFVKAPFSSSNFGYVNPIFTSMRCAVLSIINTWNRSLLIYVDETNT